MIVRVSLEQAIREGFAELAASIRYFADHAYPLHIPRPRPFTYQLIAERREHDMDLLKYEATLPAVPAGTDVKEQQFVVTANDELVSSQTLATDVTVATFEVSQDANVELNLTYLDDAGNVSAARTQEFVAKDTIAPDAPGDFGEIKLVGERTVPDEPSE